MSAFSLGSKPAVDFLDAQLSCDPLCSAEVVSSHEDGADPCALDGCHCVGGVGPEPVVEGDGSEERSVAGGDDDGA